MTSENSIIPADTAVGQLLQYLEAQRAAFTVTPKTQDDVTVLGLSGRLSNGLPIDTLRQALQGATPNVVLDLSNLNYVDVFGIGEMVQGMTGARIRDGDLVLSNLGRKVDDLLTITHTKSMFQVFDDNVSAIEALAPLGTAGLRSVLSKGPASPEEPAPPNG